MDYVYISKGIDRVLYDDNCQTVRSYILSKNVRSVTKSKNLEWVKQTPSFKTVYQVSMHQRHIEIDDKSHNLPAD